LSGDISRIFPFFGYWKMSACRETGSEGRRRKEFAGSVALLTRILLYLEEAVTLFMQVVGLVAGIYA